MTTNVFTGEPISGVRPFPVLNRHIGIPPYAGGKAYRAVFDEMDFGFIKLVGSPEAADFLMVPHGYFSVKRNRAYLENFIALAEKHKKSIIVFAFGDSDEEVSIPRAHVFRYAKYRYQLRDRDIIMPTQIYAGDILKEDMFFVRDKGAVPTVSFCGWAEFGTVRQKLAYFLKLLVLDVRKYFLRDAHADVRKQGIYWRRKALRALRGSPRVRTSFLVRDFYSASGKTLKGDPAAVRREYIENIRDSDFVLAARGDANMAVRFYEALALGRIPVVIDTEWVLPLEDVIDYKKIAVFVPHADVKNTDRYIRKFWDALDGEEFRSRQALARDTFMKYLKLDSFLRYVFENRLKP